jgi:RNA polymerase sigma factor (sigma-70 family)
MKAGSFWVAGANQEKVVEEIRESIDKTRAGDIDAFGTIVLCFQDMALGYAYSILKDLQIAEDAAQEALLVAYLNLGSLRDAEGLPGWLRRIVFTQCTRITRKKSVPTINLEDVQVAASDPVPEAIHESAEARRIVAALKRLPERLQRALALFYILGLSHSDVAGILDVHLSMVKTHVSAAEI